MSPNATEGNDRIDAPLFASTPLVRPTRALTNGYDAPLEDANANGERHDDAHDDTHDVHDSCDAVNGNVNGEYEWGII